MKKKGKRKIFFWVNIDLKKKNPLRLGVEGKFTKISFSTSTLKKMGKYQFKKEPKSNKNAQQKGAKK